MKTLEEKKNLTQEEKQIIAERFSLKLSQIPNSLELIDKEEWASDIAYFYGCSYEEAINQLDNGEGYSSCSLPNGGMAAIETNGGHIFFVSDMES